MTNEYPAIHKYPAQVAPFIPPKNVRTIKLEGSNKKAIINPQNTQKSPNFQGSTESLDAVSTYNKTNKQMKIKPMVDIIRKNFAKYSFIKEYKCANTKKMLQIAKDNAFKDK